jgi:hypothetical protein
VPLFKRRDRPAERLFTPQGTKFVLARDRRVLLQMLLKAETPWQRSQAYYALQAWRSNRANPSRATDKLYREVIDAGGEWWVADYVPEYDPSGEPNPR